MVLLMAKHDGKATPAREEFRHVYANVLAPGQHLPTSKCFQRNYAKFFQHHTVRDLVNLKL